MNIGFGSEEEQSSLFLLQCSLDCDKILKNEIDTSFSVGGEGKWILAYIHRAQDLHPLRELITLRN